MVRLIFALGTILALSACAEARFSRTQPSSIDANFHESEFSFPGGGTVKIIARAFDSSGKTKVCAAYFTGQLDGYNTFSLERTLAIVIIEHESTKLVQDLTWMNRLSGPEDLQGQSVNCVVSQVDWQPQFAEGVGISEGSANGPPDVARNSNKK